MEKFDKPRSSNKNRLLEELGVSLKSLNESTKVDLKGMSEKYLQNWNVQSVHISISVVITLGLIIVLGLTLMYVKNKSSNPPTEQQLDVVLKKLLEKLEN